MTDTVDKIVIQAETQGVQQSTADVQGLTRAMDGVTVASQTVEKSTGSIDSKFASLERRFSTTAGQAAQLAKVQQTVNAAVAANPALQDQANEVLAAATSRYGQAAVGVEKLGAAHVGLNAQGQAALHSIRSFGEQIALGIPPTQALTGQLNHLTFAASGEGGLAGAFGQVGNLIGKFVTPLTATVGIVGGAAAAALYLANSWQGASGEVDRALTGIGQRTGTTAADISNFTKANATATGLSVSQARDVALEFTKTGSVAISGLKGVGDAIQGYALLTGKDAAEATKTFANALSGDLVKGLQDIDQRYGALDSSTTEYIRTLADQGNKTQALQVYIDAIAPANQRAEASVTSLSKAWQGFKNVISNITSAPVTNTPQDTLNNATTRRDEAVANPSPIGRNSRGELVQFDSYEEKVKAFEEEVAKAQKAANDFSAGNIPAALHSISTAGDAVVRSIIPQIEQIDKLQAELNKLNDARNTPGVNRSLGQDDAAATAIQNQIAGLKDAQGQADRYNQRVAEISTQWGDVGQSTALALQSAQNQLPVLEAVGGGAKMAAQEVADYKNYMDQGKTSTEAAALATSNLAARQAQVNSSARETLATLQDQAGVAAARNPLEAAAAQAQATYNGLLREGVDIQIAGAVAAQQQANAQAQIFEQNQKSVNASAEQLALTRAQGTEYEKVLKAEIAYNHARDAGATSEQAGAIYSNTLANETIRAARGAEQLQKQAWAAAEAFEQAARAEHDAQYSDITPGGDNSFGFFSLKENKAATSTSPAGFAIQNAYDQFIQPGGNAKTLSEQIDAGLYGGGGINSALASAKSQQAGGRSLAMINVPGVTTGPVPYSHFGLPDVVTKQATSESDIISKVQQLYDLKNAQTDDQSVKTANLQEEMAWLQSRPETIARDQAIAQLTQSMKDNTSATIANSASLNPLYNGRGALQVGYYKAATGLDMIANGPSMGDQVPFHAMVNGGERITITPPGKQSSASNDNSRTVHNYNSFNFSGSQPTSRRSQRQFAQGFGQAMAALS